MVKIAIFMDFFRVWKGLERVWRGITLSSPLFGAILFLPGREQTLEDGGEDFEGFGVLLTGF